MTVLPLHGHEARSTVVGGPAHDRRPPQAARRAGSRAALLHLRSPSPSRFGSRAGLRPGSRAGLCFGSRAGLRPGSRAGSRFGSRLALAGVLALLVTLTCGAAGALADSATLTVTNTAGQSDPAAGLPRVFTVSGNVSVPERLYVKDRAPGGAACAPTAESDSGSILGYWGGPFYGASIEGSFSQDGVFTWSESGPVMFCIWIAESESQIVTPIPDTITFRAPGGTIAAVINPTNPAPGQRATITVTGASEAPERVYAKIRGAGGAPCTPNYESDSGTALVEGNEVNGSYAIRAETEQLQAGQYLVCLWLAPSANSTSAIAGPQPETFTVGTPAPVSKPPTPHPRCVVPGVGAHGSLGAVEHRLLAAHCDIGAIRYAASAGHRRGTVVRLGSRPGTVLAEHTAVEIVVSSGRPHHRRHHHHR